MIVWCTQNPGLTTLIIVAVLFVVGATSERICLTIERLKGK